MYNYFLSIILFLSLFLKILLILILDKFYCFIHSLEGIFIALFLLFALLFLIK